MGRSRRVCGCGRNGYAVVDWETGEGFDRGFSGGRIRAFGPGLGWAGRRLLELRL